MLSFWVSTVLRVLQRELSMSIVKLVKFWTVVRKEPTEDWKLFTSDTKLEAVDEILLMIVNTEFMVVYRVPTYPPVLELPSRSGKAELIDPVIVAEFKGVLYTIAFMLPPALTLLGILAVSLRAVEAAVVTAVILAEEDSRLAMELLIVVRFPSRQPSWVSSCLSPRKKLLPLVVTFPFIISSKMIEEAQLMLVIAFEIISDCVKPTSDSSYLRCKPRYIAAKLRSARLQASKANISCIANPHSSCSTWKGKSLGRRNSSKQMVILVKSKASLRQRDQQIGQVQQLQIEPVIEQLCSLQLVGQRSVCFQNRSFFTHQQKSRQIFVN